MCLLACLWFAGAELRVAVDTAMLRCRLPGPWESLAVSPWTTAPDGSNRQQDGSSSYHGIARQGYKVHAAVSRTMGHTVRGRFAGVE